MPKPNVDIVTLLALQELGTAINPTKDWWAHVGAPGDLLGKKATIETLGTIISEQIGAAVNRPDRVYWIGVDMPSGSSVVDSGSGFLDTILDPYLDGLEYEVHRRGVEKLMKGAEWQNDIAGGSIRLTQTGDQWTDGDIVIVSFKPEISNVLVAPDAVARFSNGIQIITANTILGPSIQRKIIFLNSATSTLSVTLDDTYPENVLCVLLAANGNQKNTVVNAPSGQDIYFNGVKTSFILGQSEHAQLIRIDTRWYVVDISDGWMRVGQIVMGGIPGANVISANGQTLQIAEQPRLDMYLDALEAALPGSVVSSGVWASNPTKWGRSATEIFVPKLGGWFPRFLDLGNNIDPDRSPTDKNIVGSTQEMQIEGHNHTNGGNTRLLPPTNGGAHQTAATFGPGGRPSSWPGVTDSADMLPYGGNETRPINVGLPALIYT